MILVGRGCDTTGLFSMQQYDSTKEELKAATQILANQEMQKVAFLIGTWVASDVYEKTPLTPDGGSGSGIYKTIPGPGGFSLLTDYQHEGPRGIASGHQVLTWDPEQRQYAGIIVTGTSAGYILVTGKWEGPNLVLSGKFETLRKKVVFREVFSGISAAKMMLQQYNSINGARPQLFGTTKFTRASSKE